jgi:ring-1,2-phenylacetyl-CoA epoxidase subunit PaaD
MVNSERVAGPSAGEKSRKETRFETPSEQGGRTELERTVWGALAEVHDPEIPPCSIIDLGIVEGVHVSDDAIDIDLLPTFAGCPALDVIRQDSEAAVQRVAANREVTVRFVYKPPWTSDRITPEGHRALTAYGIAPPGDGDGGGHVLIPLAALLPSEGARCPFCGSANTVMESAFGATLCRTTHFCRACRNPFEAFKPKVP